MASTIKITNIAMAPRGPLVIHLTHEIYCAAAKECGCVRPKAIVEGFDEIKKAKTKRLEHKRLPRTITLSAAGTEGDSMDRLHPSVLLTEDGKRLLAGRKIRETPTVEKVEAEPEVPTPTPDDKPKGDAAPTPAPVAATSRSPRRDKPEASPPS